MTLTARPKRNPEERRAPVCPAGVWPATITKCEHEVPGDTYLIGFAVTVTGQHDASLNRVWETEYPYGEEEMLDIVADLDIELPEGSIIMVEDLVGRRCLAQTGTFGGRKSWRVTDTHPLPPSDA